MKHESGRAQISKLKMASIRGLSTKIWAVSRASTATSSTSDHLFTRILSCNAVQSSFQTSFLIPAAVRIGLIPSNLEGLWEGLLRAVPKKKTSHRKKRQRLLAGKALQDVTALNRCSACGVVKRAHFLCPACIECKSRSAFPVETHYLTR